MLDIPMYASKSVSNFHNTHLCPVNSWICPTSCVCVCMFASVYACLCFCVKSSTCYLHYSCTTSWTITTYNLLPTCNILGVQWPTSLLPLIYINFLSIEVFFLNTLDFLWILLRSIWKIDNSINWHANMNGGNSTRSYPQIKKNR